MAITDSPDVQRLIAKTVEFQADIKQLEIYLDNERAKNKQLTTKLTEIEAYGCYVKDESGHTCGMAVENARLKEILRIGCYCRREKLISWLRKNKVKSDQPFFKDNTVVLRMIVIQQALKETEDK